MEFTKFNAKKFKKDFSKDVKNMDNEELWQMYKGITLYCQYMYKYTANKYGASKRLRDITEVHRITADELLNRLNNK